MTGTEQYTNCKYTESGCQICPAPPAESPCTELELFKSSPQADLVPEAGLGKG